MTYAAIGALSNQAAEKYANVDSVSEEKVTNSSTAGMSGGINDLSEGCEMKKYRST